MSHEAGVDKPTKWMIRAFAGLAFAALIMGMSAGYDLAVRAPAIKELRTNVKEINSGFSPAGIGRKQYQAENLFLLCSRSATNVIQPEKRVEVAKKCEGYDTMAEAYKTQGVEPPKTKEKP